MAGFSHLIRFECEEGGQSYFADLGPDADGSPALGTVLEAYPSVEALCQRKNATSATIRKVGLLFVSLPTYLLSLTPSSTLFLSLSSTSRGHTY